MLSFRVAVVGIYTVFRGETGGYSGISTVVLRVLEDGVRFRWFKLVLGRLI